MATSMVAVARLESGTQILQTKHGKLSYNAKNHNTPVISRALQMIYHMEIRLQRETLRIGIAGNNSAWAGGICTYI